MANRYLSVSVEQRLWSKVDKTDTCWLWNGSTNKSGYGWIWNGEKNEAVHRLVFRLYKTNFDPNLQVLHKCDIRNCVNPNDLFQGTNFDNVQDKVKKGRQWRGGNKGNNKGILLGIKNPSTKLNISKVLKIRQLLLSGRTENSLATEFNISRGAISAIKYRRTWAYV